MRSDASNLITDDPKYRYAPFWSVGARWQISREEFMQGIAWLDRLALRVTYGYNGNVDRSTSFMPLIKLDSRPDLYTGDHTAGIQSYGNPTLRWEKVGTTNVAVDFSLFSGKFFGKVDLYWKKGKDLIASISIPGINGTNLQKFNNAAMYNTGIEFDFGTSLNILGEKIRWTGNLTFAYNRNKITDLYRTNYYASDFVYGGRPPMLRVRMRRPCGRTAMRASTTWEPKPRPNQRATYAIDNLSLTSRKWHPILVSMNGGVCVCRQ